MDAPDNKFVSHICTFGEKKKAQAPEALRIFMVLHIVTVMTQQSKKGSTMQAFAQLALKLTSGDKEDIRGMKIADGRHIFSVYDIMWNTGAYETRDAVTGAWTHLLQSRQGKEFSEKYVKIQFAGARQRRTPCLEVGSLLKLLSITRIKHKEAFRIEMEQVLERYLDGDTSMCIEIQENKRIGADAARESFSLKVEARAAEMEEEDDNEQQGFVYGMVSEAFPGLVKIGRTSNLEKRLAQANVFSAPAPFKVVAQVPSMNAPRDERMAHAFFADQREEGEFFRVSVQAVENFFTTSMLPMYKQESGGHT